MEKWLNTEISGGNRYVRVDDGSECLGCLIGICIVGYFISRFLAWIGRGIRNFFTMLWDNIGYIALGIAIIAILACLIRVLASIAEKRRVAKLTAKVLRESDLLRHVQAGSADVHWSEYASHWLSRRETRPLVAFFTGAVKVHGKRILASAIAPEDVSSLVLFSCYPHHPVASGHGVLSLLVNGNEKGRIESWQDFSQPIEVPVNPGDKVELSFAGQSGEKASFSNLIAAWTFGSGAVLDEESLWVLEGSYRIPGDLDVDHKALFATSRAWECRDSLASGRLFSITIPEGYALVQPFAFGKKVPSFKSANCTFTLKRNGKTVANIPSCDIVSSELFFDATSGDVFTLDVETSSDIPVKEVPRVVVYPTEMTVEMQRLSADMEMTSDPGNIKESISVCRTLTKNRRSLSSLVGAPEREARVRPLVATIRYGLAPVLLLLSLACLAYFWLSFPASAFSLSSLHGIVSAILLAIFCASLVAMAEMGSCPRQSLGLLGLVLASPAFVASFGFFLLPEMLSALPDVQVWNIAFLACAISLGLSFLVFTTANLVSARRNVALASSLQLLTFVLFSVPVATGTVIRSLDTVRPYLDNLSLQYPAVQYFSFQLVCLVIVLFAAFRLVGGGWKSARFGFFASALTVVSLWLSTQYIALYDNVHMYASLISLGASTISLFCHIVLRLIASRRGK